MNPELRELIWEAKDAAEVDWADFGSRGRQAYAEGVRSPPAEWWARRTGEILLELLEDAPVNVHGSPAMPRSPFTTPLVLAFVRPGTWRVVFPFQYDVGRLGSGRSIVVPRGFETDGASIPRALWPIYQPWGTWGKAAVVHDFLYRTQTRPGGRKAADAIFLEAMKVLGVPGLRRRILWGAVRMWGWIAWRGNRKRNREAALADLVRRSP